MSEIHLEVLASAQRKIFTLLAGQRAFLGENGFYLAGGTALALQLGHRQSDDFDFFSEQSVSSEKVLVWLTAIFPDFVVRDRNPLTVHGEVGGVKMSFIAGYKYPTLRTLENVADIECASILDIALMKLLAITHRATVRDYIDLAAILSGHLQLREIIDASMKKYGSSFNPMLAIRALTFIDDLDEEVPTILDAKLQTSWSEILRKAVAGLA